MTGDDNDDHRAPIAGGVSVQDYFLYDSDRTSISLGVGGGMRR